MNYFQDLTTVEEVKSAYRQWAFKLHPDLGGDAEEMKRLNNQYEVALKQCHGQTSTGSDGKEHTYKYDECLEKELVQKIDALLSLKMEKVDILLIGVWLWIVGDTKPHKESLKQLECRWHSKRGCWYFAAEQNKTGYRSKGSLTELAAKYGCEKIEDLKEKPKAKKMIKA